MTRNIGLPVKELKKKPVENEIKEKGFFIQKMEGCP